MIFRFDAFRNREVCDFILCNPDKKEIAVLEKSEAKCTLYFNGVSELNFKVPSHTANRAGQKIKLPYYSMVVSQRLVYAQDIGWWWISKVGEVQNGLDSYKQVTCYSLERSLDNRGFFVYKGAWKFFDPEDPKDDKFEAWVNAGSPAVEGLPPMPSAVGQLYRQLGFEIDWVNENLQWQEEANKTYKDWTVSYVNSAFSYVEGAENNIVRSFDDDKEVYGHDFIRNKLMPKFECIIDFDLIRLAVRVRTVEEAVKPTGIYACYDNIVNELVTTENADDLVTALTPVGGNGLNIRSVNATGGTVTNFDYFKYDLEKNRGDWMSKELTEVINDWEERVEETSKPDGVWETLVNRLYDANKRLTELESEMVYYDQKRIDLESVEGAAAAIYKDSIKPLEENKLIDEDGSLAPAGLFLAETVEVGEKSFDINSQYYSEAFDRDAEHPCYLKQPYANVDIISVTPITSQDWRQGGLANTVGNTFNQNRVGSEENRLRSSSLIATNSNQNYKINVPQGFNLLIQEYDTNSVLLSATGWLDGDFEGVTRTSTAYLAFALKYTDNRNIEPANARIMRLDSIGESEILWGYFVFDTTVEGQEEASGTFDENYRQGGVSEELEPLSPYLYFNDGSNSTYCKLYGRAENIVDSDPPTAEYHVAGFERYAIASDIPKWIELYQSKVNDFVSKIEAVKSEISEIEAEMKTESDSLSLQKQFDLTKESGRKLWQELKSYYIESKYESSIAINDNTTHEEMISLARELRDEGKKQIAKLSQPTFSMSIDAIDFTWVYDYRVWGKEIELGRTLTIEKSPGVFYRPALTSVTMNISEPGDFNMEFSNSLRPDSANFFYMDLVNQGVSASKTLSENWQELTKFTRKESSIDRLLYDPLNRTLRAVTANLGVQDFVVDNKGIIGRRFADDSHSSFDPRQIRMVNNLLAFTRDSWQTCSLALGEVIFPDPEDDSKEIQSFGLLAESLVGSLIIGNTLYIKNDSNTITLKDDGITIKAPQKDEDGEVIKDENGNVKYEDVFHADNNGNVFLKGRIEATSGSFKGHVEAESGKIGELNLVDGSLQSLNFDLKTDEVGITSLEVRGIGDGTATIVDNLGVRSSIIEGGNLLATEALYVGKNEEYDGFKIDHNSISAASGVIKFNQQTAEEGAPINYTVDMTFSKDYADDYYYTIDVAISSQLIRDLSFTYTISVYSLTMLKYTSIQRTMNLKAGSAQQQTFNLSTGDSSLIPRGFGSGAFYVSTRTDYFTQIPSSGKSISFVGNLLPDETNKYDLGETGNKWKAIYSMDSAGGGSDRSLKNTITPINDKYSLLFDKLNAITFKWNNGESGRTHLGLDANQIEESLAELGIPTKDFAAYYCAFNEDGSVVDGTRGIRHGEIVALLVYEVQRLKERVISLENKT